MKVSSAKQVQLLVVLLFSLGVCAAAYKHFFLGFPLLASQKENIWQLETNITFQAKGDSPVEVKLNFPDNNSAHQVALAHQVAPEYHFDETTEEGVRLARWKADGVTGTQTISFLAQIHNQPGVASDEQALRPMVVELDEVLRLAAESLLSDVKAAGGLERALEIVQRLNNPDDQRVAVLLRDNTSAEKRTIRAGQLLTMAGYQVEPVNGVRLDDDVRRQALSHFLEINVDNQRLLLDIRDIIVVPWEKVLLLQRSNEPLLEVFGGSDSRITFAATETQRAAFTSAVQAASSAGNPLVDFSIYSLPVADQNTFKLLLLIPLGALVVVILRNLVGLKTSGTFMPVLIALTFLQTSLLTGLALFLAVVGVGLVMRSYLSHLNLLLVPRIASVLVFVIIIYGAIGIVSTKMGWEAGLKVTVFPMIILSWTIERMSILWDEDGPREVFVSGGGSLLTAILAYLLMSNRFVSDTIFLYPELLLSLLSIIIAIGSYSGYRLSDLRRFEPMERHH